MRKLLLFSFIILVSGISHAQNYVINAYAGTSGVTGYTGDGGQATVAEMKLPIGVAVDDTGNVYIADQYSYVIRKVSAATGIISTFAGNGKFGYKGDGGKAINAEFAYPAGVAVDDSGNVYVDDENNNVIRRINLKGIITTYAGDSVPGYHGDGGPASAAELNNPSGIAFDKSGNLYIADEFNNVVRMVNKVTGIISTVAGDSIAGYYGDGGKADTAQINYPYDVAVDDSGNIYISDQGNNLIRKVNTKGYISTVVGNINNYGYSGNGGLADTSQLNQPYGIAVDHSYNLFVCDQGNEIIREVGTDGILKNIAGIAGYSGNTGDGGAAIYAYLNGPSMIAIGNSGDLFFSDTYNNYVRKLCSAPLTPGAVTGPVRVCPHVAQTYSITPVAGATDYTWVLPAGWHGTSTTTSISATADTNVGGQIMVSANNSCGPSPFQVFNANVHQLQPAAICFVTVDTASLHNVIIWNKTSASYVDSFKIYFYNSANKWQKVTEVPFTAQDYYVDTMSINNPNANTVRYVMTAIDSCGNEDTIQASRWQNTEFIIGNGAGTFFWTGTEYKVQNQTDSTSIVNYVLYRDTLSNDHWQAIDSVSYSQNQMTDPKFSSYPNGRWRVEVRLRNLLCPDVVDRPEAANITTSRSNTQHNTIYTGINGLSNNKVISVYPNPAGEELNVSVSYSKTETADLKIVDVTGRVLTENQYEIGRGKVIQLNIAELPAGVYFVKVETSTYSQVARFVKQ